MLATAIRELAYCNRHRERFRRLGWSGNFFRARRTVQIANFYGRDIKGSACRSGHSLFPYLLQSMVGWAGSGRILWFCLCPGDLSLQGGMAIG